MNTLKEKLEQVIEKTLEKEDYRSAAELGKAIAAIRSAEAQERNAASIERTLAVIAGIGEGLGELTKRMNPEEISKMMQKNK